MAPSRRAGPSDLILFEKWLDFSKWLFERTMRWPKHLRHTLTQRIETLTLEVLEDITTAAYQQDKTRTLQTANERPNRLRVLLRLAHEMTVLSHAHYQESAQRLSDAGRLLGAWLKQRRCRGSSGAPAMEERPA